MIIHKTCNLNKRNFVELPTHFIDSFLSDCPPVYPLIFIWSYRKVQSGSTVTAEEIMKEFRLTGSDVRLAWRHWEQKGLVSIGGENQDEVSFLDAYENASTAAISEKRFTQQSQSRPVYTPDEIACYRTESPDVARLFLRAEKTLGKLLSYNDMNIIFGFHDWLRLPIEVIEYLFAYCDDNDHRNIRYIEKCALDWADQDITSLEAAMFYVKAFDRNYRTIFRHMGLSTKYPSPRQKEYMDKWLNEYRMPIDVITYSCEVSVDNINQAKFSYMNTMLDRWFKQGVKTKEDAQKAREAFSEEEKSKKRNKPAAPKTNRFINFNQREYDWAALEKLERAYQDKKYGFSSSDDGLMVANDA